MDKPDIDLNHLYIKIPILFPKDKIHLFEYKNVFSILEKQNPFDLVSLQEWVGNQLFQHIDWELITLNVESVTRAFILFDVLGIKPKDCIYDEKGDLLDDLNK